MNDPVSRHPGAETMAAFLEGKLAPGEVAEVAAHLRDCADCRTVTGETARFTVEEEEARARRPRVVLGWKSWAAVAAAAAIVASVPLLRRPAAPLTTLIDASPREYRRVEGRLSGFPWARLQGGPRGASATQAEHKLIGAAHEVLGRTTEDDAAEARHAAGVAHLLIDQTAASLNALANAAGDSKDARIWNDLAAARFAVAVREDRAAELPLALAAVDRAIQLDPRLPEAHFNRALILERLGTRDAARQEWQRYLELEPASEWSNEARQHLRALGDGSHLDFDQELQRAGGDRTAIAALVRRFPQEARRTGEFPLLGEWADAHIGGDTARAAERLALIRTIAEELAATKGERLLLDVVNVIERTPGTTLAQAHRRYRDARVAYLGRRVTKASEGFRDTEPVFRLARSPMADVAACYFAKTVFDRNGDATQALTALRARIDATRHRALAAEIDWALALQAASAADWGTAARISASASEAFTELSERQNASWMDTLGANALERIGEIERAWRRRVRAMAALTSAPRQQQRLAAILHSAAVGLAAADHIGPAAAVMDVSIATPSNPELRAIALIDRARLAERAGDLMAAQRWLGEARAEMAEIADGDLRKSREAQIELARAVLRRASDPHSAMTALDRSVAYFEQHRQGIFLSDAFLQRARAHRAAGRLDAAGTDYRAALQEIDRQRENVNRVSVEFLDVAAQAIDESVELHLERGEIAEAFDVTDRAHALAAREYRPAIVPDGVAVIEYAVLPHAVAIFCVTREGIFAEKIPIERTALAARVLSFARKMRAREDVRSEAASLHALLIAPVASRIASARELVIVPDRQLHMLPFAALHDGRQYLIEKYVVRVAPSMAMTEGGSPANRQPPTANSPSSGVVVIADPASDRAPRLPWSLREAESIAAIYGGATILAGSDATRARVTEAIASSTLVHYAGHADSDAGESYGALLLASDGNDFGLLSAGEIARLDLRARPLVVLSACGTLRGQTTHVAGMPSLARAFLGAGARAVVGTLWEVDDDVAAPLFLHFHESLRAGEVPAGALRAAQLAMLQSSDPRERHPASWSPVEVLSNL